MTASFDSVRIGIDVGGTFTHAVAINALNLELIGKSKVPTTHDAPEGVALGIIQSLEKLLKENNLAPQSVSFIAHSTTQATNALVEGDVAVVGVLGMGKGVSGWLARHAADVKAIELAPGKHLRTIYRFVDTGRRPTAEHLQSLFADMRKEGAQAFAISEAFGVDNADNENFALEVARGMGLMATAGSDVSKLYGLTVRTRTATINAAMLPKMIETANMTERSVRSAGIKAPIMVMRSDGGVMDIDAMRQRPILTRLSGPAAGVAAAMMYLNISDGVFLEVGGTTTDISVIRNGKALVKETEIGGHRVFLRSLDVKTVGVAGGSMTRLEKNQIKEVGPRSAHIAGLHYTAFSEPLQNPVLHLIRPKPQDPPDYVALSDGQSEKPTLTLTPSCAANLLNLVPAGDPARGSADNVKVAMSALARSMSVTEQEAAERLLNKANEKLAPIVERFIKDYKLHLDQTILVGGGGGAAAIVPYLAKQIGARHALAQNADVISAIGVALALVRETVERFIVMPRQEDVLAIREEAFNAVLKMGADPASIEVQVEVDPRSNVVRATAFGAAGLTKTASARHEFPEDERLALVSASLRVPPENVQMLAETPFFKVFGTEVTDKKLFGLLQSKHMALRIMDSKGVIRLQVRNGVVLQSVAANADKAIQQLAEEHASYGDAGKVIPDMMLLSGWKIIDLSGLPDTAQVVALAKTELETAPPDTPTVILAGLE
jgi:N-methylhydantoinase A/oxoprolinase/acetone carboxylase beta subunit